MSKKESYWTRFFAHQGEALWAKNPFLKVDSKTFKRAKAEARQDVLRQFEGPSESDKHEVWRLRKSPTGRVLFHLRG